MKAYHDIGGFNLKNTKIKELAWLEFEILSCYLFGNVAFGLGFRKIKLVVIGLTSKCNVVEG